MTKFKNPLLFALSLLPIAIAAGISIGYYQLEIYSEEVIAEVIAELGSTDVLIVISLVQTVAYTLFCGFFGYILANKLGLWKPIGLECRALVTTITVSVIGGALFSLDYWTFGSVIEGIKEASIAGLSRNSVIASVLYGGVIEEIMMRLFFMSLTAFILWKIFAKRYDEDEIPNGIFVISNIIVGLLFAAGHLPATLSTFGELSPLLLVRCFLLNGGFGLIFGRLYRKYGIIYAIISHALFHIVSKAILLIFI